uniref:Uncharacterized protein n=1 Tax=Panagrolaimus sp. PS1159 TaxID=55785 RepID=A0AC35G169_9BILA
MHVNILNAENTPVAFEEILRLLPKIIELKIMVPQLYTTSQTFETLQNLKFVNKIQMLDLRYLTYLEPYGFSEFLKINLDSTAEVLARFQQNLYENEAVALQKEVENKLHDCWPESQKPLIQILCQY